MYMGHIELDVYIKFDFSNFLYRVVKISDTKLMSNSDGSPKCKKPYY
ncbi:hypothetical protein GCM10009001_30400 [Virgibacillus siamensis]|uniref:Uncharacterized protein n=1 Tax=Virgibacillus siamensis TaxID=480071 RepID=A0ABN1GGI6_9BACI